MRHGQILQTSSQPVIRECIDESAQLFFRILKKNKLEHQEDFSTIFLYIGKEQRNETENLFFFVDFSLSNPHISNLISTKISPQMPSDTNKKKRNKTKVPVRGSEFQNC